MNKLTGEEVLKVLNEILDSEDKISYYAQGYAWKADHDIPALVTERLGPYEEVDQYGGEGEGDKWYTVKYFKNHDVYIKTDGFYSSYDGTSFNYGVGEVVSPKQKTITVYE